MVNRFNKSSRNYVKTICAAVSILVFLCIWQLVVSFTKAGLVLAGPVDTLTAFFVSIVHPIGTYPVEFKPCTHRVPPWIYNWNCVGYSHGVV